MATGVSRPRRGLDSYRSNANNQKISTSTTTRSYPLPVTAVRSSPPHSPRATGRAIPPVTTGPTPGSIRPSNHLQQRQPPPPSQDPGQYAQHFPSLPDMSPEGGNQRSSSATDGTVRRLEQQQPLAPAMELSADDEAGYGVETGHRQPIWDSLPQQNRETYPMINMYGNGYAARSEVIANGEPSSHMSTWSQPQYIYPQATPYGMSPESYPIDRRYNAPPSGTIVPRHPAHGSSRSMASIQNEPMERPDSPMYCGETSGYLHYIQPQDTHTHGGPTYLVMNNPPPNLVADPRNYISQQPQRVLASRDASSNVYPPPMVAYPIRTDGMQYLDVVADSRGLNGVHTPAVMHDSDRFDAPTSQHQQHIQQRYSSADQVTQDLLTNIRVRVVISGWKAGIIIGRQGQVISNLRLESKCRITISDDTNSPDRVLTIIGHSANVTEVLRKVCFMIGASTSTFHSGKEGRRTGEGKSESDQKPLSGLDAEDVSPTIENGASLDDKPKPVSEEDESMSPVNFTLAVPSPLCGCLIGRGGNQIRNFKQTYGVAFSVSSHSILESLDRPVNISGPPANVAACLKEVCRLFALSPAALSTINNQARRQRQDTERPAEAQSRPGGGFRLTWRHNLSDAEIHHHGSSDAEANDVQEEKQQPRRRGATAQRMYKQEDSPQEHAPSGEILGSAIEECSFELSTGDTEVHLLVPNDIVGCIIGKGGKTISEIRETSGAHIAITDTAFPPSIPANATSSNFPSSAIRPPRDACKDRCLRSRDRVICIRGRSKNVRTARYLMGSSILNAQRGGNSETAVGTRV